MRLTTAQRTLLDEARRAVLATIATDGRAELVPICYSVARATHAGASLVLYTPIDEKPKRGTDPMRLGRVRNLVARPAVAVLVDRWAEDWTRLAWLRLEGHARILPAGEVASTSVTSDERAAAIAALRARYPQYRAQALETRPLVRIDVTRVVAWSAR